MIRKWIRQLREKPRQVKSHVAFVGAGVVTSVIALVWMTTVPARFESVSNIAEVIPEDSTALLQDALSPSEKEEAPAPRLSEEETLRAKVDTLLQGLGSEKKSVRENALPAETSTKPTPILIETTTTKKESSGTRTILIATSTSSY